MQATIPHYTRLLSRINDSYKPVTHIHTHTVERAQTVESHLLGCGESPLQSSGLWWCEVCFAVCSV